MIALVLAAGLTVFSAPRGAPAAAACSRIIAQTSYAPALLMRPEDWAAARPRKLGDLPEAKHEYAVLPRSAAAWRRLRSAITRRGRRRGRAQMRRVQWTYALGCAAA